MYKRQQDGDVMSDFKWIGCEINNPIVQKPTNREVFHLGDLDQKTPDTDLAQLAIDGVLVPKPDVNKQKSKDSIDKTHDLKNTKFYGPSNDLSENNLVHGDGKTVANFDIPKPSITRQEASQKTYSSIPAIGREAELEEPFYIRYLKHILITSISGLLIVSGLIFYLTSYQPNQQLQINVERYVAEKQYVKANKYLDKVLKERPNWREKVAGIRRDQVFDSMQKLTSQKINQFVGSSPDKKKERYEIAKLQINDLQDFINYFSSGSSEAAKISDLIVTYNKAEKRYLDSLNSEIVKNTSEPDSTPETKETVEPDNNLDQNSLSLIHI